MKKTKNLKKLPEIIMGPFKKVTYYQADIEGPDHWLKEITNVGRQVITDEQYLNIGLNYIITNMINNKFDLSSIDKPSVSTIVAEKNRQQLQNKRKKIIPKSNNVEVKGKFYVDPPTGWMYGFPAAYDKTKDGNLEQFLISKGYPKKDAKWASKNCRMWYED